MRLHILFAALLATASAAAQDTPDAYATLQRAAVMVKDRPATVKFYRDVLGYAEEQTTTDVKLAPDHPLGLPSDAVLSMTYMKSRDGAYVAVMGVDSQTLPTLERPTGSGNAYNDVMLVHIVRNVDEIYKRAMAGGYTVLSAPRLSRTGAAKQMLMRDPNGIKLELNEILKKPD
jgi:catechol 2,3-dioxygenase-like lactoylglutathione lyase family enzyme